MVRFGASRDLSPTPARPLGAAALLLLGGLLPGCGGSPPPSSPTPERSPAVPPAPATSPSAAHGAEAPGADPEAKAHAALPPAPAGAAWPSGPTPSVEERAAQLERLGKDAGPLKSNWVPPGKGERYGHAEGLIAAPPDVVRAKLADFAHYKDLAGPKFKSVRVVAKEGLATDVYFQLPIMKGLVTIWYVTRFAPPRPAASGGDLVEGMFVKGNIKSMHIAFKVQPGPDERSSIMVCDLLLTPSIPAPQSALDEELRDACGDAINSVRRTSTTVAKAP